MPIISVRDNENNALKRKGKKQIQKETNRVSLFFSFLFHLLFSLSDTYYWHLLLSQLHFAITSSHYNTPCITTFSLIYYLNSYYAND